MNQVNYQRELEQLLNGLEGQGAEEQFVPRLFLHSCCAPCSSYVLEYLCRFFNITVFYYNPNISSAEEYRKRVAEQKRLIDIYNKEGKGYQIRVIEGHYHPDNQVTEGLNKKRSMSSGTKKGQKSKELKKKEFR